MKKPNTKTLLIIGLAFLLGLSIFFMGRGSKKDTIIYTSYPTTDSLRIELRKQIEINRLVDSINNSLSYKLDSILFSNKVSDATVKIKQKKNYENTQKMSLDSAVVARNILLDSAIKSQSRVRTSTSDSSN